MSTKDAQILIDLLKRTRDQKRSKAAIKKTFQGAGIIDKNGNLKKPYREIYFPIQE